MTAIAAWLGFNLGILAAAVFPLPTEPLASDDNPLAHGFFCPRCGTRLDKADRPCPLGCPR